jgi:steroid delta-isomerase-like uncharacterized protein
VKKFHLILPVILVLCFLAGCQDTEALAELEEFKAQAKLEEQNKALVRLYIETFNGGDYEALMELLSPEYAVYSPSGYPEPTSRELLIKSYQGAREAFSELTWSIEDLVAAQDKVISRIIAKGTYKGGVPGLPKDEIKFEFSMITIMRIDDGKIVEEWQEDDQLGLVRQLGMELKPKEIEK